MLNYDALSKKTAVFRQFSGLEVPEFHALNLKIEERYPAYEQKRLSRPDRKRGIGAGHPLQAPYKRQAAYAATLLSLVRFINVARAPCRSQPKQRAQRHTKAGAAGKRGFAAAEKAARESQATTDFRGN